MKLSSKVLGIMLAVFSSQSISDYTTTPSIPHNPDYESVPDGKSYLCITRENIGFNWRSNKWVKTNFKNTKYIVKKVPKSHEACDLKNETDYEVGDDPKKVMVLKRCYTYKNFDSKTELGSITNTSPCYESYDKGKRAPRQIQCTSHWFHSFAFVPNGEFMLQSSSPTAAETPKGDEKDSHVMSVGTCSEF